MLSESEAIPLAIVLGILCIMVVRSREVVWWVGALFFLWGFTMASTTPGLTIANFLEWLRTYVLPG